MLFEEDGITQKGLLIPTWTQTVLAKRHESTQHPNPWYKPWKDWCRTRAYNIQKCTALWYINKDDQQKDLQSGRKEWIECLNWWTRFGQQFEKESDEESGEEEEVSSEGTGGSEEEEEETSEEEVTSEGKGESEEEKEETSEEVSSEGTGESEGFSSRGEGSSSESVKSDTHSSEYSETESNKRATDAAEESETGIFPNKRKQEKQKLTAILTNVSKAIQTLQVEKKHSWDGIPYPEVSKIN